jgi:murein peptide amidase A
LFSRVVLTVALLALPLAAVPGASDSASATPDPGDGAVYNATAVVEKRVIGHSVRGRPIVAWRVGKPSSTRKVVIMSTMHGDEPHTRRILTSLRDGWPIRGADMWLIPVVNPDGLARHTRKNARGVDLNRNFPNGWRNLDGRYESGRAPASEPETKAVIRFLREIKPRWIVSFHQPLYGVDVDTKRPWFARRLADQLNLPTTDLDCGGVCHGTMTGWYNHNFAGAAITVEYGPHPSRERMTVFAPRQLLRALYAERYQP